MRTTLVLIACLLVLGAVSAAYVHIPSWIKDNQYVHEEPCVRQGGLCRLVNDCDPGNLVRVPGLCPAQRYLGVECCYD